MDFWSKQGKLLKWPEVLRSPLKKLNEQSGVLWRNISSTIIRKYSHNCLFWWIYHCKLFVVKQMSSFCPSSSKTSVNQDLWEWIISELLNRSMTTAKCHIYFQLETLQSIIHWSISIRFKYAQFWLHREFPHIEVVFLFIITSVDYCVMKWFTFHNRDYASAHITRDILVKHKMLSIILQSTVHFHWCNKSCALD